MKILFVTENSRSGGLDSFMVTLMNHWPYPKDEFLMICNKSHPGLKIIQMRLKRKCKIIGLRIPLNWELLPKKTEKPVLKILRKILKKGLRYGLIPKQLRTLTKNYRKYQPDYLISVNGGYPAGEFCRLANIAWYLFYKKGNNIHNFHNMAVEPRWFERPVENFLDSMLKRSVDKFVTVSRTCANSMQVRPKINGSEKIDYILNGIDTFNEDIEPSELTLKKELNLSENSSLCLMLATYEPRKGHKFLCKIFKKVLQKAPNAHLVICGYGSPEEMNVVKSLILNYDLEDHTHLLGFRNDISALINQSDLLLVASQESESFGLTSVEAMALKIPVIATRVGGIPEVVSDGEGGYCFEPDDVIGYANCILQLLSDKKKRQELGEKGYLRYQKYFTGERMAKEYGKLTRLVY
jgi:L-malate glycosyltransferase